MAGRPGSQENAKADCQREHRHGSCPLVRTARPLLHAPGARTGTFMWLPISLCWLARTLHLDPVHHLQRRWGKKLTVFTTGSVTKVDH